MNKSAKKTRCTEQLLVRKTVSMGRPTNLDLHIGPCKRIIAHFKITSRFTCREARNHFDHEYHNKYVKL